MFHTRLPQCRSKLPAGFECLPHPLPPSLLHLLVCWHPPLHLPHTNPPAPLLHTSPTAVWAYTSPTAMWGWWSCKESISRVYKIVTDIGEREQKEHTYNLPSVLFRLPLIYPCPTAPTRPDLPALPYPCRLPLPPYSFYPHSTDLKHWP